MVSFNMRIRLVAFGIAKDILKSRSLDFEFEGTDIDALKDAMVVAFPEFAQLKKLSFAVGEEYREDSFSLEENAEVVIIPPVSGG